MRTTGLTQHFPRTTQSGPQLAALAWMLMIAPQLCWAAATFELEPGNTVLEGDPVAIRLTDAPKGKQVKIRAVRALSDPTTAKPGAVVYRSEAVFAVPADGTLDLATAAPRQGSYQGADVRGLFWSMRAVNGASAKGLAPMQVTFTASMAGRDIATTKLTLLHALPQVSVVPVEQFPGATFASIPGERPRPAVILLGGSEGNAYFASDMAPRLASRGFAVLGLPYYSPSWAREIPQLPAAFADIPVERLNTAFEWLQQRTDVDSSRVALYGVSKGAEYTLLAASRLAWVKAAVAIVPSDVVWEGFGDGVKPGQTASFAFEGRPLPFVPYQDMAQEFTRSSDLRIRRPSDAGRAAHPAAAVAARIAIENFKGPLLVVGGHDDQVWASGMMALNIAERRAAAGLQTESLVFLEAGHVLSDTGFNPIAHYYGRTMNFGGTPEATARAQGVAFPRTMAFLQRALAVE